MIAPRSATPSSPCPERGRGFRALAGLPFRRPSLLVALTAALALVAAMAGGDLGGAAVRALAVVAILGLGLVALRRGRAIPGGAASLLVPERCALGRDSGVALVEVGRRRYLVGYGPAGVALLAPLDADPERSA